MKLSRLIDLETRLLHDEAAADTAALERRDRAIGAQISQELGRSAEDLASGLAADRELRHRVCDAWLRWLPSEQRAELPGARIAAGLFWAGLIAATLMALAGMAAAAGTLHANAKEPANVFRFLAVFCALQILLLILLPLTLGIRRLRGRLSLSPLQRGLLWLSQLRLVDRLSGGKLQDLPEQLARVQTQVAVYRRVQSWQLFALIQRAAISFNLAALLVTVYLIAFTDLAFCWTTTLEIEPAALQRSLEWIAAPWSFTGLGQAPELAAIEVSRWVPTEGGFLALPPELAGQDPVQLRRSWWPFLVASLLVWGILPRLLAWTWADVAGRRAAARIPLNHVALQHLYARLFPRRSGWQGPSPDSVQGKAPEAKGPAAADLAQRPVAEALGLCCWGSLAGEADGLRQLLGARFGGEAAAVHRAGQAELEADTQAIRALQQLAPRRVVLALPEGQQPTKDLLQFLRDLRAAVGAETELLVVLLAADGSRLHDVDADEQEAWESRLRAEGDPYLALQRLEAPSP